MEVTSQMAKEVFGGQSIKIILDALASLPAAQRDFVDGLDKRVHALTIEPGEQSQNALVCYVRDWMLDVLLTQDTEWQESVAATSQPNGPAVSGDELRRLVLS